MTAASRVARFVPIKQMVAEEIEAKLDSKVADVKEKVEETVDEMRTKIDTLQKRPKSKRDGK